MKKQGDKAIKRFIRDFNKSAAQVIQDLRISPNTLYRHPEYRAAVAKREQLRGKS